MYSALLVFLYILSCLFYTAIFIALLAYESHKGDKAEGEDVGYVVVFWLPVIGSIMLIINIFYAFADNPPSKIIASKINKFAQGE